MADNNSGSFPLQVVDGLLLDRKYREALRPAETLRDLDGQERQLPRYFYEVPSWDVALKMELSPHFYLWEFIQTDIREADPLKKFPRYVPCAVTLLAVCLERLREAAGTFLHISANGGYRSPSHALTRGASLHCWGTAANIYRIGSTYLDDQRSIERCAMMARDALPGVWSRSKDAPVDPAEDHLHLDLGYVISIPRNVPAASQDVEARR